MSQQTGEDERSLHRILELLRISGILVLLLHFYYLACPACQEWQAANPIAESLMTALANTGLFLQPITPKLVALSLLAISLLGARGKKSIDFTPSSGLIRLTSGVLLYFGGALLDYGLSYVLATSAGFLLVLHGGTYLSRIVWRRPAPDVFNRLHESFPQQEYRIENDHSVHFPAEYVCEGEIRDSWINIIDPFRGLIILGSPGSGKTWFIIESLIRQQLQKGYSMLLYDFKYPDLSQLAYNYFQRFKSRYPGTPGFYTIQFDDPERSHRCNPLHPSTLRDISDGGEAARALLLGMNMEWIAKQGEFFVESAISFVTTLVWFLRLYEKGRYCSWPHVIELAQIPYKSLFTILRAEPQLLAQITPFVNAWLDNASETLHGQIVTATISLSRLSSPAMYFILTGDDLTLDLNNPAFPKVLAIGSNPQKNATYGPIIAAYINTINRLANRKGMHPFTEILEEFSTVTVHTIDKSIATGRSNHLAITLCMQNADQLRLAYGREFADVVLNGVGNIISGQSSGETAKWLSERFSRTLQDRESLTSTNTDLNITQSLQLEHSIPTSRIASLSSGEFVGMVADNPAQPIDLKTFCCRLLPDPDALDKDAPDYADLPIIRHVTEKELMNNFLRIRADIENLVIDEMTRIAANPELKHLILDQSPDE